MSCPSQPQDLLPVFLPPVIGFVAEPLSDLLLDSDYYAVDYGKEDLHEYALEDVPQDLIPLAFRPSLTSCLLIYLRHISKSDILR